MARIKIDQAADWRLYWGPAPLPASAAAVGTVEIEGSHYRKGALIQLQSGIYVQGNGGAIRTLPQAEIAAALGGEE